MKRQEALLEDGVLFHTKKGKPQPCPRALAPLADTHGHLTVFREQDPACAIARAALAGLRLLVVPADPTEDAPQAAAFLGQMEQWIQEARLRLDEAAATGIEAPQFKGYSDLPALVDNVQVIVGVHPYGAGLYSSQVEEQMEVMLADPRCTGVGEIGLDYTCKVDPVLQQEVFRQQLAMACERDLPCELHIRDAKDDEVALAHQDALRVLDEVGMPSAGVDLHCFTSNISVMEPFVERGCYVAFGGALTFKNTQDIRDAAMACPANRLLSETDSPYMAPVPLRGCECEPAMVALTARALADLRAECGLAVSRETYEQLWANACELFAPLSLLH